MLANLRALFSGVVDIILLRGGPEKLPASQTLLAIVVGLSILGTLIMATVVALPTSNALLETIVGSAVMLLWFRAALAIANKLERYLQTMTAIFGVNAVFAPVIVPLQAALLTYVEKQDPATPVPTALFLITIFVWAWAFAVQLRIVKSAFECPWFGAVLLLVGESLVAILFGVLLFGAQAKAAA